MKSQKSKMLRSKASGTTSVVFGKLEIVKKSPTKIKKIAFILGLIIGGFWFLFSFLEMIGGILTKNLSFLVGGLIEIISFGGPILLFTFIARKKGLIGAILLLCWSLFWSIFMFIRGNAPMKYYVQLYLVLPIVIVGILFLISSIKKKKR